MTEMQYYINMISKYELLKNDEQIKLIRKAQKGNIKARNKLVLHNLRLVIFVSKKYFSNTNADHMDIICAGNLGLFTAIDKFDETKCARFSTYAYFWIRQNISRYLEEVITPIRIPSYLYTSIRKIQNKKKKGKRLTQHEEMILLCGNRQVVSMQSCLMHDGMDKITIEDTLPQPEVESKTANKDILTALINKLKPQHKEIIQMRLDGLTLKEVGNKYKLTRERIRQIEVNAMDKLKFHAMILQGEGKI